MNVLIPLGGKGERFARAGERRCKPLIPVLDKEILAYVLDNVLLASAEKNNVTVVVVYAAALDEHGLGDYLCDRYPQVRRCRLPEGVQTRGAAETVLMGLREGDAWGVRWDRPCLLLDCDTHYTFDVVDLAGRALRHLQLQQQQHQLAGALITFQDASKDGGALFSYVAPDPAYGGEQDLEEDYPEVLLHPRIADIAEKRRLSPERIACTGAYLFATAAALHDACEAHVEDAGRATGELYTSAVIKRMVDAGQRFASIRVPASWSISLGTPQQVAAYVARAKAYLFDMDGTLVVTDHVYEAVWRQMLEPFNVHVDEAVFSAFVAGQSDATVLRMLGLIKDDADARAWSELKDRLFLERLADVRPIPGAAEFMRRAHRAGHRVCVVTNANRTVAVALLDQLLGYPAIGPGRTVEHLVVGAECARPKPFPDPFERALHLLNMRDSSAAVVFEDSRSGLLSATAIGPRCVVGVRSGALTRQQLLENGADVVVDDFEALLEDDSMLHVPPSSEEEVTCTAGSWTASPPCRRAVQHRDRLRGMIADAIVQRATTRSTARGGVDVVLHDVKLKGGFIADVLRLTVSESESGAPKYSCVVKLQGMSNVLRASQAPPETLLVTMASEMRLHEREAYFYQNIRDCIPDDCFCAPKCHGIVRDPEHPALRPVGIILEDLDCPAPASYVLNLDLNREPLDTSHLVVERLARLHARFWGKDLRAAFPSLQTTRDNGAVWLPFVRKQWAAFEARWHNVLSRDELREGAAIAAAFERTHEHMCGGAHTLCHGDVKSANIFYRAADREPFFIDWQYVSASKGVQDLVFFLIESFDATHAARYRDHLCGYYLLKLRERGVTDADYSDADFWRDVHLAARYYPFFVAVWFGVTPKDQLVDANFPYFFIRRLFAFLMHDAA